VINFTRYDGDDDAPKKPRRATVKVVDVVPRRRWPRTATNAGPANLAEEEESLIALLFERISADVSTADQRYARNVARCNLSALLRRSGEQPGPLTVERVRDHIAANAVDYDLEQLRQQILPRHRYQKRNLLRASARKPFATFARKSCGPKAI
jgi:hypothetical protein